MAARVGIDLKLFEILSTSKTPMTVEELSSRTNATDSLFLGRLMRYLASIRMVVESGKDTFAANHVTEALANPGFQGGLKH
jgi:demethylsterigmatocystin 6-O-methyltransferase